MGGAPGLLIKYHGLPSGLVRLSVGQFVARLSRSNGSIGQLPANVNKGQHPAPSAQRPEAQTAELQSRWTLWTLWTLWTVLTFFVSVRVVRVVRPRRLFPLARPTGNREIGRNENAQKCLAPRLPPGPPPRLQIASDLGVSLSINTMTSRGRVMPSCRHAVIPRHGHIGHGALFWTERKTFRCE